MHRNSWGCRLPALLLAGWGAACATSPVIDSVSASPAQVAPGGTVTVSCAAHESNNVLSYSWTVPVGWTVVGAANLPSIVLQAPATFALAAIVGVTVADQGGNKVSSQIAIGTTADAAPVINSLSAGTDAIAPGASVNIVVNASSPTGLALTYTWTSSDPKWTISDLGGGVAVATGPGVFSDSTVLSVVVADSAGLTASDSIILTTTSDVAPVISSVTASASVIAPAATATLSAVATSPTGAGLTFSWASSNSLWILTSNTSSASVIAPSAFSSSTVISVTATDATGLTATKSVQLSTSPNAAPTISSINASPNPVPPQGTVTIVAAATSPTGSPLSYTWTSSDPTWNLSSNGNTATLGAPPTNGVTTVISVTVTDATGLQVSDSVAVATVADAAPVINALSANPNPVTPGTAAVASAGAFSPSGSTLAYNWFSSNSAWKISGSGSSVSVTAPSGYSAVTVLSVQVTDTNGLKATDSVVISTTAAPVPQISQLIWTPNNPQVGNTISLTAVTNVSSVSSVSWAWAITGKPNGSSATLTGPTTANPTFVPDISGSYQVSLVASVAGVTSAPATAEIAVGLPAPTALISGNQTGAVNTPLAVSGAGSTAPGGDPLAYRWSFFSGPTGATGAFFADQAETTSGNTVVSPYFTGSIAGSYVIGLQVTDQVTNQSATTTLSLTLLSPAAMTWITGSSQTATVNTFYDQPFVFQVTASTPDAGTSGGAPELAGLSVSYSIWNGSATTLSTVTDQHGSVSFSVRAGRVAEVTGALTVWLTDNPNITATANFALTADKAAFVSLLTPGVLASTDFNVPVTVQVVDEYGNPSGTNAVANESLATLTVTSGSALIAYGGSNATSQQVQLNNGSVTVQLIDTVAETVGLTMTPASAGTQVLPFAAWQTTVYDSGQFQMPANAGWWSDANSGSPPFDWELLTNPTEANTNRVTSYGVSVPPSMLAFSGAAGYLLNTPVTTLPGGTSGPATLVLAGFEYAATVTSAYDANHACTAQPALYGTMVQMPSDAEFTGESGQNPVEPLGGYTAYETCSKHASLSTSPVSTTNDTTNTVTVPNASGWGAAEYDVTDAVLGGYPNFEMVVANVADPAEPSDTTTLFTDDVWTSSFVSYALGAPAVAPVVILPGAPKQLAIAPSSPPAFGSCVSTPPNQGFTLALSEEDSFGNLVPGSPTGTLSWTTMGSPTPTLAPVGVGPGISLTSIPFGLVAGTLSIAFQTQNLPPGGQVAFSYVVNSPSTVPAGKTTIQETCHADGLGDSWQDLAPTGTYNVTEATNACEASVGVGNCATSPSGSFVFATSTGVDSNVCTDPATGGMTACSYPESYAWYFKSSGGFADECGATVSAKPGGVQQVVWMNTCFECVASTTCPGATIGTESSYVALGAVTGPWK